MKIKIELQSLGDDGYHIFCKVKINGIKCRALIDTGASKTVVGKQMLKKLKLLKASIPQDNQMTGIQPGELDVSFALIETIAFGKLKFNNIFSGLIDLSHVAKQYKTLKIEPFQIIIGGDILYKGKAVIDYKNKYMKLTK